MPWRKKPKDDKWLQAIESLAKGNRAQTPHEHLLDYVAKQLIRPRIIICPDVAVVSIADQPSVGNILTSSLEPEAASKRDQNITEVLTAVLRANPKADLSTYETSF